MEFLVASAPHTAKGPQKTKRQRWTNAVPATELSGRRRGKNLSIHVKQRPIIRRAVEKKGTAIDQKAAASQPSTVVTSHRGTTGNNTITNISVSTDRQTPLGPNVFHLFF